MHTSPVGAAITAPGGTALGTQPVVYVTDAVGALVTSATNSVTVALYTGSGTLAGTLTKAAVSGVATFTDLTIAEGGTYSFVFTASGLSSTTSVPFTMTITETFTSTWATATGTGDTAILDGSTWSGKTPSGGTSGVLSVVTGISGSPTTNCLKCRFRGTTSGKVLKTNAVPASTTFWGRFYVKLTNTSQSTNHAFSLEVLPDVQFAPWSWSAFSDGWTPTLKDSNNSQPAYPNYKWFLGVSAQPNQKLSASRWYRYEWMVEYITSTTVKVWPRIYDDTGALIATSDNFFNAENPFPGNDHTTLTQYYASHTFTITDTTDARSLSFGTEGPAGTSDTDEPMYFAKYGIALGGWLGA